MAGVSEVEVVVSGVTGHFPKSNNVEEFKENLFKGIPLQTSDLQWKSTEFKKSKNAGVIEEADKFDAEFFGILPIYAHTSSPERRKLLEAAYEAIFDAGLTPNDLKNTNCGVYIGLCHHEFHAQLLTLPRGAFTNPPGILALSSLLSNSISYWLDLKGPSLRVDSGCSSSLNALHVACEDIRSGRCNSALVGGVEISRIPYFIHSMIEEGYMSENGYCKTFDASADGYGRTESISMVFLQKAQDAKRIYCTVIGSRSGQEGFKENGISQTFGTAHAELIKELYAICGFDMKDVAYIELHGTGTQVGDTEEAKGLDLCLNAARKEPLLVGSVKSNIGHPEANAGLVGLTKVIIAMETGNIPPNVHFKNPNPKIAALMEGRMKVVAKTTPLPEGLVGINSFGVGGSVVHCLLKRHSAEKRPLQKSNIPWLVACSGTTKNAVSSIMNGVLTSDVDPELVKLVHDIHGKNISNHFHRGYAVLGQNNEKMEEFTSSVVDKRPICFFFAGLGSQWPGMGRFLMDLEPFRETVDQCVMILSPLGIDIRKIMTLEDPHIFDYIVNAFVGVIVFQIALVNVLKKLSIVPDVILGQSAGELTCAYTDGCLSLEETVLAAYYRGLASINSVNPVGAMAVVGKAGKDLEQMAPKEIEIACYNSPTSCVISGPKKILNSFCDSLEKLNISAYHVPWTAGLAYHSSLVKNAGAKYLGYLREVIKNPTKRSHKWISSSAGGDVSSAQYHYQNFTGSVYLETAFKKVPANAIVIEIGPNGILTPVLEKVASRDCFSLCERKSGNSLFQFLTSIGKLYNFGGNPNLSALYPEVKYPVSRGTKMLSPLVKWNHTQTWTMPTVESNDQTGKLMLILDPEEFDYVVDGKKIFPFSSCMSQVWNLFATMVSQDPSEMAAVFDDVHFHVPVIFNEKTKLHVQILPYTGHFEVTSASELHVSGTISLSKRLNSHFIENNDELTIDRDDMINELEKRGLQVPISLRGLLGANSTLTRAELQYGSSLNRLIDSLIQLAMLLSFTRKVQEPVRIKKLWINTSQLATAVSLSIDKTTGTFSGNGIEAQSVIFKEHEPSANVPEPFVEKNVFVPFNKTEGTSFREAFHLCLHLVAQNNFDTKLNILRLRTKDSSFPVDEIEKTCERSIRDASFQLATINSQAQLTQGKDSVQLIMTDIINEDLKSCLKCSIKNGFLLIETRPDAQIEIPGFVFCVDHAWAGKRLVLLRKMEPAKTFKLINLDEDGRNSAEDLKKIPEEEGNFLLTSTQPCSGIIGLVSAFAQESGKGKIRSIFLKDSDFHPDDLSEYEVQLKNDLLINVLEEGRWGTFAKFDVSDQLRELPNVYFDSEQSFIVLGGLGGVGRELIAWMISKGARKFVITSQGQSSSGYQQYIIDLWKAANVEIIETIEDITTLGGASAVISMAAELGTPAGIFVISTVDIGSKVIKGVKVSVDSERYDIAVHFDQLSQKLCPQLKYFVMLSTLESKGGVNLMDFLYNCSRMDRLSECRMKAGYPSLSIQFDGVANTGSQTSMKKSPLVGVRNQSVQSCIDVMEKLLQLPYPVASSVVLDHKEKPQESRNRISKMVAAIVGIRNWEDLPPAATFKSLGIDSMTIMRIQGALQREWNKTISISEIQEFTFGHLAEKSF